MGLTALQQLDGRDLAAVPGQHAADRPGSGPLFVLADEPPGQRCGRSSSAARKAEAALRISPV